MDDGTPRPLPPLRPRELLRVLREHAIEFVVIGGLSLAPHGYVRATEDLDVVPEPTAENLTRLAAALRAVEASVDLRDLDAAELSIGPDAEGLARGGNWCLVTRYGRLDVMQDVPGIRGYAQLRDGAVEVGGVLYAGLDDLIAMKSSTRRPQDLVDLAELDARARP